MSTATRILCIATATVCLTGCAAWKASRVDANWGSAQEANTRAMIVNPEGTAPGERPDEPADGTSAQTAVEKHRSADARPPRGGDRPSIINIGGN